MDDFEVKEMLRQLGAMMQGAGSFELVQRVVDAYDHAAQTAYEALMGDEETDLDDESAPAYVAERAWAFADAMMAERVKRGLGSPPEKMP